MPIIPEDWVLFIPNKGEGEFELHTGEELYGHNPDYEMLKNFYAKWFNDPNYRVGILAGGTPSLRMTQWCLIKIKRS